MADKRSGYGIIGLGRFGLALSRKLAQAGKDVLVIDESENNLRLIRDDVPESYLVGTITREALEETGIANCEVVIICITKIDVSVLTAYNVIDMGVPRVLAKAASKEHGAILEKLGAETVHPETETANRVAAMLLENEAVDLIRLFGDYVISELLIPEILDGCTLADLRLDDYDLRLVAAEIEESTTLLDCEKTQVLHTGDYIVITGRLILADKFEREVMKMVPTKPRRRH